MKAIEAKVKVLASLVEYKKSGVGLCKNSEEFEDIIIELTKQIRDFKEEEKGSNE